MIAADKATNNGNTGTENNTGTERFENPQTQHVWAEAKQRFDELKENDFFFEARAGKGNWVANSFNKWLKDNPKEKKKYDGCNRKAKEARRKKFANMIWDQFEQKKEHKEEYEEEENKGGKFLSVARIAVEEGYAAAPQAAVQAATNYAIRCLTLGDKWFEFDSFTKTVKFLYVVKGIKQKMKQAWTTTKKWSTTPASHPLMTKSRESTKEAEGITTEVEGHKEPGGPNSGVNEVPPAGHTPRSSGEKTEIQKAIVAMSKIRSDASAAKFKSSALLQTIDKDKDWCWAKTLNDELNVASNKLDGIFTEDAFLRRLMAEKNLPELAPKDPRRNAEFLVNLQGAGEKLAAATKVVDKECRKLQGQKRARDQADHPVMPSQKKARKPRPRSKA